LPLSPQLLFLFVVAPKTKWRIKLLPLLDPPISFRLRTGPVCVATWGGVCSRTRRILF